MRNVDALQLVFLPTILRERIERLRTAGEKVDDEARVSLAEALEEAVSIVEERAADLRNLPVEHPDAPPLDDLLEYSFPALSLDGTIRLGVPVR